MVLSRWRTLSQKELFKNPWWVYRHDTFMLPNGEVSEYFYVHTNGSSMVIPVLDDGRIAMVRQYRYLCDELSLEFPCGGVKAGSDFPGTARAELEEEAGYTAGNLDLAGQFNPFNGITNEICRVYVATNLTEVGPKPEQTEEFEYVALTPAEIDEQIRSGVIWDGMSIAAWSIARSTIK
ncbi:MAG TPA: NUDIX hydrolase [Bacteroidota bacterium]|nr:NUDIX hydrolase [Bacteroidota bacterium]